MKTRTVIAAAVLLAAGLAYFLAWRNLGGECGKGLPDGFAWREAGDEDLL